MAHNSSVPAVFNTHSLCTLQPSKPIFDWNLALPKQRDTRCKDKYVRMLTSSHCPNRQIYRKVPNIYLVLFMLTWLPQVIYLFIFVGQCKISLHCTMFSRKVSQKFINLLRLTIWLKLWSIQCGAILINLKIVVKSHRRWFLDKIHPALLAPVENCCDCDVSGLRERELPGGK